MKIAIISDTHDNHAAVVWIVEYLNQQNITVAFHAGDLVVPRIVNKFIEHFNGHLHFIFGNNDGEQAKHMEYAKQFPEKVTLYLWEGMQNLELDGKRIFMNHYSDIAELVAQSGKYDICIGGHDHRYRTIQYDNSLFINPGNTTVKDKWTPTETGMESSFVILDLETMEHERVMLPENL